MQTTHELFCLLKFIKIIKPKIIFEFGLFRGESLKNFTLNTDSATLIYSLDITAENLSNEKIEFFKKFSNVKIFTDDSTKMDFSDFYGKCDFIFIDGGHDYDVVKSDSENAIKMLSDQGVIVWDDFNLTFPGIQKVIRDLVKAGYTIYQLQETSYAVFCKDYGRIKFLKEF